MQDKDSSSPTIANGHSPSVDHHGSLTERQVMMQARRKSRGYGSVPMLNPNFVFPPLPVDSTTTTSSSTSTNNNSGSANGSISSLGGGGGSVPAQRPQVDHSSSASTLAPPAPRGHEQFKTHFRQHSRNGSTVTVKDLKDAIAKASVDLLEEHPSEAPTAVAAVTDGPCTIPANAAAVDALTLASSSPSSSSTTLQDPSPAISIESTPTSSPPSKPATLAGSVPCSPSTLPDLKSPVQSSFGPSLMVSTASPVGSRPPSLIGSSIGSNNTSRSSRDRSTASIPPFFAYSVPHEYPSSYASPRLKLPGAQAPVSLPVSPFLRKNKPRLFHANSLLPSSTLFIKLSASAAGSHVQHGLPVGSSHAQLDLWTRVGPVGADNLQEEQEQIVADSESHDSNEDSIAEPGPARAATVCENQSNLHQQMQERQKEEEELAQQQQQQQQQQHPCAHAPESSELELGHHHQHHQNVHRNEFAQPPPPPRPLEPSAQEHAGHGPLLPSALSNTSSISAADKRMSWASMVTLDELEPSTTTTTTTTAAPYRPPGARAKSGSSSPWAERAGRSLGSNASNTDLAGVASTSSSSSPSSRPRKAAPPPLNLVSSNNPDPSSVGQQQHHHHHHHHQALTVGSPTTPTPTTPSSRRRRSRSRKNAKDKEGVKAVESEAATTTTTEETVAVVGEEGGAGGAGGATSATPEKKTRTRSRSRSRSRSRAKADKELTGEIPPVPQTPSWVPVHNMAMTGSSTLSSVPASPRTVAPPSQQQQQQASSSSMEGLANGSHSDSGESVSTGQEPSSPTTTAKAMPGHAGAAAAAAATTGVVGFSSESPAATELSRRGPRPARLTTTRLTHGSHLQTVTEGGPAMFSPRRDGSGDYFSMRPLQHAPRTPMTPMTPGGAGGEYGEDDDDYYSRLPVTTPMIQQGFFPNWAKGDAQLEELQRIRTFLADRQYPDEMPLSDEWTLFFSDTSRAKDKSGVQDAYSSAITPLFSCHTVPQFATSWKYVRERVRPGSMKVNQNLHWFKKGIKPIWEDPKNKYGGRLTICPPRALLDIVWETVLILMAGDVLDLNGEGTGAVFARRARGDRIEVWLGSDDTPEALAHIRGRLAHELASSGAEELIRTAKYKKHFDSKKEEKMAKLAAAKEAAAGGVGAATAAGNESSAGASGGGNNTHASNSTGLLSPASLNGSHHHHHHHHQPPSSPSHGSGLSSPVLNGGGTAGGSGPREYQSFQAFAQEQAAKLREREREQQVASSSPLGHRPSDIERIMQLGKERLEKERAERERLREEKVRAMTAAAMAASEAKHQQQRLQQQQQRH